MADIGQLLAIIVILAMGYTAGAAIGWPFRKR